MSRKKNKRKHNEYLINTIEYSTWENELTLSHTFGDVVSTYIQTKCLPAVETTLNQHVVSDVTLMRNDHSPDDVEVDIVDVQTINTTTTTTQLLTSADINNNNNNIQCTTTATQKLLTSTQIENSATLPTTVNICEVENGFQLNSGASMKNDFVVGMSRYQSPGLAGYADACIEIDDNILKSSSIVVSPSFSATKPGVNKLFNPSTSTVCLRRLKSLINSQATATSVETTKSPPKQYTTINLHATATGVEKTKSSPKQDTIMELQRTTPSFSCTQCEYKCSYQLELSKHMSAHYALTCELCGKKFWNRIQFALHMVTHSEERREWKERHICVICSKEFSSNGNLYQHMLLTHKERPNTCTVCRKEFSSFDNLGSHKCRRQNDIRLEVITWKCPQCEYSSHLKDDLTPHIMDTHIQENPHLQEKPFSCKLCSKAFYRLSHLTQHEAAHSDVKRYQCPHCNYSYHWKNDLTRHMNTHMKRYECPHCEFRSHLKGNLIRHLNTHNRQEKSFACKVCSKTFSENMNLKRHDVTHSDVKRYECPHCEFRSHWKGNLTLHMNAKHSGEKN